MTKKAPGKADREGMSLVQLMDTFSTEEHARKWFEDRIWPNGRTCPKCGSARTHVASHPDKMPYRCTDCRAYFSVKTGTVMNRSPIPLRKWAIALYLHLTSLKGVSSMKLHRDIEVSQPAAWFMLHRIRQAWSRDDLKQFIGPIETDETYIGGLEKNKHRKKKLKAGPAAGKAIVVGAKDRESGKVKAKVIENATGKTLKSFVAAVALAGSTVYTDGATMYKGMPFKHESVDHSGGEYVRGEVHTNGIESFWAMLERAHKGIYHKMSPKHMQRYVNEFSGRHNLREFDTVDQMSMVVSRMPGKALTYDDLTHDNGLPSGARG